MCQHFFTKKEPLSYRKRFFVLFRIKGNYFFFFLRTTSEESDIAAIDTIPRSNVFGGFTGACVGVAGACVGPAGASVESPGFGASVGFEESGALVGFEGAESGALPEGAAPTLLA